MYPSSPYTFITKPVWDVLVYLHEHNGKASRREIEDLPLKRRGCQNPLLVALKKRLVALDDGTVRLTDKGAFVAKSGKEFINTMRKFPR